MGFQDEMKQMFLRIAAGDVEPEEWETWWNSNRLKLEETLTRGDRGRIMPALWSANYYWMTKTQGGLSQENGVCQAFLGGISGETSDRNHLF